MVEKTLSVAPTIEPESNLWWRDAKVELPPRHHTPCPRGNNPEYAKVSDTVWLYYEDGNQTEGTLEGNRGLTIWGAAFRKIRRGAEFRTGCRCLSRLKEGKMYDAG